MIDSTSSELQKSIDSLLQQMQTIHECLNVSTEVLFIFNGKRETLEEKKIKEIFHELAAVLCRYLEKLHRLCLSAAQSKTIEQSLSLTPGEKIAEATSLLDEIRLSISELRKIARYDLNFLEQYFEYDYCAKLDSELHFVERVQKLLDGGPV